MKISVFLSYPKPHMRRQQEFIDRISQYLNDRGFSPRTLGVTDYDMDAPLTAIRRLMLESNGLITVAFRRLYLNDATLKKHADIPDTTESPFGGNWLTSPYCHIEPAMAYQIGLPTLIIREKGVIDDGILEKGVVGGYMPEFDITSSFDDYFRSLAWHDVIGKWEGYVRSVVKAKGSPPSLF